MLQRDQLKPGVIIKLSAEGALLEHMKHSSVINSEFIFISYNGSRHTYCRFLDNLSSYTPEINFVLRSFEIVLDVDDDK